MKRALLRTLDALLTPLVYLAGTLLARIRRVGLERLPLSGRVLRAVGVLPVVDHYYEPYYRPRPAHSMHHAHPTHPAHLAHRAHPTHPAQPAHSAHPAYPAQPAHSAHSAHSAHPAHPAHSTNPTNPAHPAHRVRSIRHLPGIDLNIEGQLELLAVFRYGEELERFPLDPAGDDGFHYQNGYFGAGDAEFFYSLIRRFRPRRIIEIGAGHSTRIAQAAVTVNRRERVAAGSAGAAGAAGSARDASGAHDVVQICIEPYENPWLEALGVQVIREPVESLPLTHFTALEAGDILFIDSSHVVRPGGDVLYEFLEILPSLRPGVLVHIHDIFTPRDYPEAWLVEKMLLWDEQYLLEAFLTLNDQFEIIGALNHLAHDHTAEFCAAFPVFASLDPRPEPGSFWIRRVGE